jgi:hypothetical protein
MSFIAGASHHDGGAVSIGAQDCQARRHVTTTSSVQELVEQKKPRKVTPASFLFLEERRP